MLQQTCQTSSYYTRGHNMDAKAKGYLPYIFRQFQGYTVSDIKEFHSKQSMELHLTSDEDRIKLCNCCGLKLGKIHDRYFVRARHLRAFNWSVVVCFWREKRHCENCKKVRSEWIDFLCPTSPHMTLELAWWINRLTEITSVMQVSHLESVDKMTCYKVDKHILNRLLQGYKIPKVTHISVDEVYARSPKQQKENETRDDLFLTVIVDHRTHKVIWVSQSRRKEALDLFFEMIGPEGCKDIEVVTCDQHRGYGESVANYCPRADLVWDRFHLVQNFNEALNEERKIEFEKHKKDRTLDNSFLHGKNRYLFLQKANNRTEENRERVIEVFSQNQKLAQLEMIKERFHRMFEICQSYEDAMNELGLCYEWCYQIKANHVMKFFWSLVDRMEFFNYFKHRITSGVSEGINRTIKTLKWQAYGYKDMAYFALKIMQKCGYLNSKNALSWLYNENT